LYGITFIILLVGLIIYLGFYNKEEVFIPSVNFSEI